MWRGRLSLQRLVLTFSASGLLTRMGMCYRNWYECRFYSSHVISSIINFDFEAVTTIPQFRVSFKRVINGNSQLLKRCRLWPVETFFCMSPLFNGAYCVASPMCPSWAVFLSPGRLQSDQRCITLVVGMCKYTSLGWISITMVTDWCELGTASGQSKTWSHLGPFPHCLTSCSPN